MRSLATEIFRQDLTFGARLAATSLAVFVAFAAQLLNLAQASAAEEGISIELNKLEVHENECRAYFVIDNKNSRDYEAFKLDLVLFRPDGVIAQRFAVDLAPLNASKRSVKLFDMPDTACDQVGSILVNEVMECKVESREEADCLKEISVSSRAGSKLVK